MYRRHLYRNQWTDGTTEQTSENRPGEYWYPMVNFRRLHGATYEPYKGDTEWARQANITLAAHARANFERRR